jgi:hypothetical protein
VSVWVGGSSSPLGSVCACVLCMCGHVAYLCCGELALLQQRLRVRAPVLVTEPERPPAVFGPRLLTDELQQRCVEQLAVLPVPCGLYELYDVYGTVRYCTVLYGTIDVYGTVRYCTVFLSVRYCTALYGTVRYCAVYGALYGALYGARCVGRRGRAHTQAYAEGRKNKPNAGAFQSS